MKIDYETHYAEDYFSCAKRYRKPDGTVATYVGPGRDWHGFEYVADAMLALGAVKPGDHMLDVGCGAGAFVDRMLTRGIDAWGLDVSNAAIAQAVGASRPRLAVANILDHKRPSAVFDFVTALDVVEHIYEEDQPHLWRYLEAACAPGGVIFCCVATAHRPEEVFVLEKNAEVPLEREWQAVSGHVNVRGHEHWLVRARELAPSLDIAYDLMYAFQVFRSRLSDWTATGGWDIKNTYFWRKKTRPPRQEP